MALPAEGLFGTFWFLSSLKNIWLKQNLLFLFGAIFVMRAGDLISAPTAHGDAGLVFWSHLPFAHLFGLL